MTVADLSELYAYGAWASAHLLRVTAELSAEEFTQSVAGSYESVRNTFVHTISAQWGWVDRCGGQPRGRALEAPDFPTVTSVREISSKVDDLTVAFLSSLEDDDLARAVTYSNSAGESRFMPIGEMLHHAANHAVHHRGQIALLLRELNRSPGNFDILFYYAEKRGVVAW